jgi:hypothetical protein
LKSVSASPFKQQQSSSSASTTSNTAFKSPTTTSTNTSSGAGKVKISSQFLQSVNNQNNSNAAPKPNVSYKPLIGSIKRFDAITASTVPQKAPLANASNSLGANSSNTQNRTAYSNGTSTTNGHGKSANGYTESPASYSAQANLEQNETIETAHPSPRVEKSSVVASMPSTAASAATNLSPPSYLRNQNQSDEEDEWGNPDPIKITPTYTAPLATYDEHDESFSSPLKMQSGATINEANANIYNQIEKLNEQVQSMNVNHGTNSNNNSNASSLTAFAIYDYQAADEDEISFDPNDIITDIIQVEFFNLIKNHLINS